MNFVRKFIVVLIPLLILGTFGVSSQVVSDSAALGFFLLEDGADFPAIQPLGVHEDQFGNIHSWFFYIEPQLQEDEEQFIYLYYSVVEPNGKTTFTELDSHPFSLSPFAFFEQQNLHEFANGTIMALFLKNSDLETKIKMVTWSAESGLQIASLAYPEDLQFTGKIIGPVANNATVEYYLAGVNDSIPVLYEIAFPDVDVNATAKYSTAVLQLPTVATGMLNQTVFEVFDMVYANGSRFWLASFFAGSGVYSLNLIEDYRNGTLQYRGSAPDIDVGATSIIPFLRSFRNNVLSPELVATTSGQLYSFFSNLDGDFAILAQWKNNTASNVFGYINSTLDDPFFLTFLHQIGVNGNDVLVHAISFQYAQDVITFTVDTVRYNTQYGNISKSKFQDAKFSDQLFLFALDDAADHVVGISSTFATPEYILLDNKILNASVGAVYLFSDQPLPDVTPVYINLTLEAATTSVQQRSWTDYLYLIILIVVFLLAGVSIYQWRKEHLSVPDELQIISTKRTRLRKFSVNMRNYLQTRSLFLKTNKFRVLQSTFVLFIPALILMLIFVGLLSHQAYLMHTFEAQNPLNDNPVADPLKSDFLWQSSWYDTEFTNNTITASDVVIAEELSRQSFLRYGLPQFINTMAAVTTFPLFTVQPISFENNGENVTFNFPVPNDFAVISSTWQRYFESNLLRGRLPSAPNEVLLQEGWFVPRNFFTPDAPYGVIWDVGTTLELQASELDVFLNTTIPNISQNVTVVGVIKKVENQPYQSILDWAKKLDISLSGLKFLDTVPFYAFPEQISQFLTNFSRLSLRPQTLVDVRYNVFDLDREEIPSVVDSLSKLGNATLQETGFSWIGNFSNARITNFLESYYTASRDIQLEGSVLTIPVLILTLLLTYEALGIGKTSIQSEIVRLKREGLRTETMINLYVLERVVATAAAVVLSLFFTKFLTEKFLSFTGFFGTNALITPPVATSIIAPIAVGVFITLLIVGMFRSIQYLLSSEDWKYAQTLGGIKGDLIIILIGLLLVALSNFFAGLLQDQVDLTKSVGVNPGTELIFLSMRLVSLLLATFGGLIIISKLMNRFYAIVGMIGWKLSKSRKGLVFNSLRVHIDLYSKSLVIFLISFFILVPMFTVPFTIDNEYKNEAYYDLGSDMIVNNWDKIAPSKQAQILNLSAVYHTSKYFFGTVPFTSSKGQINIRVFAIDPATYVKSIIIPTKYSENFNVSFKLLSLLKDGDILTNEAFVKRNGLEVGDRITVKYDHTGDHQSLKVAGTYNQVPILKYELSLLTDPTDVPLQMIISLDTLKEIQTNYAKDATQQTGDIAKQLDNRDLIMRVQSYDEILDTTDTIKQISGSQIDSIIQKVNEQRHPFFRAFEFITHISIVIVSIAPILSVIIVSRIVFERRKDELEVFRRIGTRERFFVLQMIFEIIFAVLIPSLVALPLGMWWAKSSGPELFGQKSTDLEWVNNYLAIGIFVAATLLISLAVWVFQITASTKQHIREVRL